MRVKGEQLYVFIGEYPATKPLGASTDCSISLSAEVIEISPKGKWRRFRTWKKGWSVEASGFFLERASVPTNTNDALASLGEEVVAVFSVLSRDVVDAGIKLNAPEPDIYTSLRGKAILTRADFSGSRGGIATYNITLQGSGELKPLFSEQQ